MSRFLESWKKDLASPVPPVVWAGLTLAVGTAGPFGSQEILSLPMRLLFWGAIVAASILVGTGCRAFVQSVLGLTDFLRGAPVIALMIVTIATWPIYQISSRLLPPDDPRLLSPWETALFIGIVSIGVGAFREALRRSRERSDREARPAPPAPDVALPGPSRLIDRLVPEMQAPLISISGRDHYVDIVTEAGRASLLMRFADAIAEAGEAEGVQIHRSHWVAWRAAAQVGRQGDKVWVELADGTRLPVSRNRRAALERRGLL